MLKTCKKFTPEWGQALTIDKLISIVIPNYNGKRFLECVLSSIKNQTYKNFEIILVDNNSQDNSIEFVQSNFPEVKIIKLTKNYGYAGGANAGIKKSKGKIIIVLNNDVELDNHFLEIIHKYFINHPDISYIAPLSLNYFQRDIIDTAGDIFTKEGKPFKRFMGENIHQISLKEEPIKFISGVAFCVRKEALKKVGLFNEVFFAYLEDVDLSFRLYRAGYKAVFLPDARLYHFEAATTRDVFNIKKYSRRGLDTPLKTYLIARNKLWVIKKNLSKGEIIKNLLWIIWGLIKSAGYHFRKSEQFPYFFLGTMAGIIRNPKSE